MASTRGFEHLHLISKSIHELYRGFGPKHLKSFDETFVLGDCINATKQDPVISAQLLAKRIVQHYRLPLTTVIVVFSSTLEPPGRVELSQSNEFFIELQSRYKFALSTLAAILAHEVAHIFLHRCGVRFSDEFENEILTDTTAAFVGFGPTILNAASEKTQNLPGGREQALTHHFGYITLDEFGYIIAKRDTLFGADSTSAISPDIAASAFVCGRHQHNLGKSFRPFIPRPWHERLLRMFRSNRATRTMTNAVINFSCPNCAQRLRIPETYQKISVHCSNCDSRFICYS